MSSSGVNKDTGYRTRGHKIRARHRNICSESIKFTGTRKRQNFYMSICCFCSFWERQNFCIKDWLWCAGSCTNGGETWLQERKAQVRVRHKHLQRQYQVHRDLNHEDHEVRFLRVRKWTLLQ